MHHRLIVFIVDGAGHAFFDLMRLRMSEKRFTTFFTHAAIVTNKPLDDMVADSASAATALSTGVCVPLRCISMGTNGKPLQTCMESARDRGFLTGLVVTSTMTDATPAAFFAHAQSRYSKLIIESQILNFIPDIFAAGCHSAASLNRIIHAYGQENVHSSDVTCDVNIKDDTPQALVSVGDDHRNLPKLVQFALNKTYNTNAVLLVESSHVDKFLHICDKKQAIIEMNNTINTLETIMDNTDPAHTTIVLTSDHGTSDFSYTNNGKIHLTMGDHSNGSVPLFASGKYAPLFKGMLPQETVGKIINSIVKQM